MKKFLYLGPNSGVTLKLQGAPDLDVMLWNKQIVELPEDHDYTRTLSAQGLLQEAPVSDAPAETATDIAPGADASGDDKSTKTKGGK